MSGVRFCVFALMVVVVAAANKLSKFQIQEMLFWHNKARSEIANAGHCGNMLMMEWDAKIAAAQEANPCPSSHNGQAEKNYGSPLGENLSWGSGQCPNGGMCAEAGICGKGGAPKCESNCQSYCSIKNAVYNMWYQSETPNRKSTSDNCKSFNGQGGHCSQVNWQSTTMVGCSYQSDCGGSMNAIIACSYKERGNFNIPNPSQVFLGDCKKGKACSACPESHPECVNGLCSKDKADGPASGSADKGSADKGSADKGSADKGSTAKGKGPAPAPEGKGPAPAPAPAGGSGESYSYGGKGGSGESYGYGAKSGEQGYSSAPSGEGYSSGGYGGGNYGGGSYGGGSSEGYGSSYGSSYGGSGGSGESSGGYNYYG